jgi:hypothetical protein
MFAVGAGLGNKVQPVRKRRLFAGDQIVVATGWLWPTVDVDASISGFDPYLPIANGS